MPIYEYVCEKCGKLNDMLQKVNDPPPERCNGCGAKGKLTKIVSRSSFVLRGGGWYADGYGAPKSAKPEAAKEKDGAPAKADASPAPAAKPAASSDSSSAATPATKNGGSTPATKK